MDRERLTRIAGMVLGLGLLVPLGLGFVGVGWVASSMPPSQADRIVGPHGLIGVRASATYAWIVPTAGGVVLVDAGMEPGGRLLKAEVGDRKVQAILLTHAHADHVMGLDGFPDVPVYALPDDIALLKRERVARGWLATSIRRLAGDWAIPATIEPLTPDRELVVDEARFWVVAVPGHTDGSAAFLWEDVLFAGDAVWGGAPMITAPAAMADAPELLEKSLDALVPLSFDVVADGHVGLTSGGRAALMHHLGRPTPPPTISVRSDEAGPRAKPVQATGILVRAPVPDARGHQPELLLLEGRAPWRLSSAPVTEHDALVGRKVVVAARPSPQLGGLGVAMDPVSVAASPEPTPELASPTSLATLSGWAGRWVPLSGRVTSFAALEPGSAWGEGRLVLADGAEVTLAAPVASVVSGSLHDRLARVELGPAGPRVTVIVEPAPNP